DDLALAGMQALLNKVPKQWNIQDYGIVKG
ncbi:unnamed protein product, partial [marine sediment metagenome]